MSRRFRICMPKGVRGVGGDKAELEKPLFEMCWFYAGLHKLWYPSIRDASTWSKFGAHGEHGDVFLFSNLGAL